jgi:hypothetical protein
MVTVAWNPLGFHLFDAHPDGRTFNTEGYRENISIALIPFRLVAGRRKFIIRVDNVKTHTARKYVAFCTENGLYSPRRRHAHLIWQRQISSLRT